MYPSERMNTRSHGDLAGECEWCEEIVTALIEEPVFTPHGEGVDRICAECADGDPPEDRIRAEDQPEPGDLVRSFDFAHGPLRNRDLDGERACYVEGEILKVLPRGELFDTGDPEPTRFPDCARYVIRVTRRVFAGVPEQGGPDEYVFPPVNGTPTWGDRVMNGVELIEEG